MTNIFDNFARRYLGQQYAPLNDGADAESGPQPVPGSYPASSEGGPVGEEPVSAPRAALTSHNLNHAFFRVSTLLQVFVYKPLMIFLLVLCRLIAAFIKVMYFRDKYTSAAMLTDPIDNANKFVQEIEYNLSPAEPLHRLPPFFQGSYTQALFMATNRAKFLFVYLAHPQSEGSSGMFQHIITAPEFVSLFQDPDFIIWGGDLTNSELYQLANSLNVTRFPFLGLLCLTRSTTMMPLGPVKSPPKILLVLKVQGRVKDRARAQRIIASKFQARIAKYEGDLREIRHELMNSFMSQVLVKQQDINYQNLLARDRAKKLQRQRDGQLEAYFKLRVSYFDLLSSQTSNQNSARVGIRFGDGSRLTLKLPSSAKVTEIYEFVELYRRGYLNSQQENASATTIELEVAPQDFKFTLVSSVPPRSLLKDYWGSTVGEVDFVYPNGMLIVEDEPPSS